MLINGETGLEVGTASGPPRNFMGVSPLCDVILSSSFLLVLSHIKQIIADDFPGLRFRPVYEELIISIPWRKWIAKGKIKYPPSREPEDYFHEFPIEPGFEQGVSTRLFEVLYQDILLVQQSEELGIEIPIQKDIKLDFFAGRFEGKSFVTSVFCSEKFRDTISPYAEFLEFKEIAI